MLLKDLQTLATKLATGTLFHVEKAGKAYSVEYSALAKAIIEEYADSTVGGSKQSVQAAIGALNSSMYRNTENTSTYSIPVPRKPGNGYHTVMVYGGTGRATTNGFLILVFIDLDSANRAVVFPVLSHGNITFTASWNASSKTLTLNASSTVYGGINAIVF